MSKQLGYAAFLGTVCLDVASVWTMCSGQDQAALKASIGAVGVSLLLFSAAVHFEEKKAEAASAREQGEPVRVVPCNDNPLNIANMVLGGTAFLLAAAVGVAMLDASQRPVDRVHFSYNQYKPLIGMAMVAGLHLLEVGVTQVLSHLAARQPSSPQPSDHYQRYP